MRELCKYYGKPIGTNTDELRRVAFLASLPSILSSTILAKQGEVKVRDVALAFQDWLPHVQQERDQDFEALMAVCTNYDTRRTQYSAADELHWRKYERKLASEPNTKKPTQKNIAISWLRPLKGLPATDYRRLCIKASTPEGRGRQQLFFVGYTRGRGKTKASLREHATRLKEWYAAWNVLRYLSIKTNARQYSWREFLQYPLSETMANPATVRFFAQHWSTEFTKKWSEPTDKGPVTMKSYETLIPSVINKHYEAMTAYSLGFEGHTWRSQN